MFFTLISRETLPRKDLNRVADSKQFGEMLFEQCYADAPCNFPPNATFFTSSGGRHEIEKSLLIY